MRVKSRFRWTDTRGLLTRKLPPRNDSVVHRPQIEKNIAPLEPLKHAANPPI